MTKRILMIMIVLVACITVVIKPVPKVEALTNCHLQAFSSYTSSYCTGASSMVPYQYAQQTCNDPVFGGSWIQRGIHAVVNQSSTAGYCNSQLYYITGRNWHGTPFSS